MARKNIGLLGYKIHGVYDTNIGLRAAIFFNNVLSPFYYVHGRYKPYIYIYTSGSAIIPHADRIRYRRLDPLLESLSRGRLKCAILHPYVCQLTFMMSTGVRVYVGVHQPFISTSARTGAVIKTPSVSQIGGFARLPW